MYIVRQKKDVSLIMKMVLEKLNVLMKIMEVK